MTPKLEPAFQQVLDAVDEQLDAAKARWNQAHARGDDKLIEKMEAKLREVREARQTVFESLLALQASLNEMRSRLALTDEELDDIIGSDASRND